jgi:hypothetical protein
MVVRVFVCCSGQYYAGQGGCCSAVDMYGDSALAQTIQINGRSIAAYTAYTPLPGYQWNQLGYSNWQIIDSQNFVCSNVDTRATSPLSCEHSWSQAQGATVTVDNSVTVGRSSTTSWSVSACECDSQYSSVHLLVCGHILNSDACVGIQVTPMRLAVWLQMFMGLQVCVHCLLMPAAFDFVSTSSSYSYTFSTDWTQGVSKALDNTVTQTYHTGTSVPPGNCTSLYLEVRE